MYAIILAGGSGTRLWPLSREKKPKQLLSLFGEDSLLKMTIQRLLLRFRPENILVVGCMNHKEILDYECEDLPKENIIYEPEPKGTASALLLGALELYRRNEDAFFVLINSDHVIRDDNSYHDAIEKAFSVTDQNQDQLTLIGIKPVYPETGYGYIKIGNPAGEGVFFVDRFVEKPDRETAGQFLDSGNYLWNLTLVVGKIRTLLNAYKEYMPEHFALAENRYSDLLAETIDYGILEKMKDLLVIPADFDWVDVGHFRAVHSILKTENNANVTQGKVIAIDSSNNLILNTTQNKIVAVLGIENLAIVETSDALLVCPLDRAQEVRKVVKTLNSKS